MSGYFHLATDQNRPTAGAQHLVDDAAQNNFNQWVLAIAAHNDQADFLRFGIIKDNLCRIAGLLYIGSCDILLL